MHKGVRARLQYMYSALCCIVLTNPLRVSWLTDKSNPVKCTRRYDKETIRASPYVFTKRANSNDSRVRMSGDIKIGPRCSWKYSCYSKVNINTDNAVEARPPELPRNCMFIQPRHFNTHQSNRITSKFPMEHPFSLILRYIHRKTRFLSFVSHVRLFTFGFCASKWFQNPAVAQTHRVPSALSRFKVTFSLSASSQRHRWASYISIIRPNQMC
jgi:hypothetical protein